MLPYCLQCICEWREISCTRSAIALAISRSDARERSPLEIEIGTVHLRMQPCVRYMHGAVMLLALGKQPNSTLCIVHTLHVCDVCVNVNETTAPLTVLQCTSIEDF